MKKLLILFICNLFCFNQSNALPKPGPSARTVITKMLAAIAAHKGYSYTMTGYERNIGLETTKKVGIDVKVINNPSKIYVKLTIGNRKDTEILYCKGERDGNALVNAGRFLPNLTLDPLGTILTEGQRHTIFATGFGVPSQIIGSLVKTADNAKKFDAYFSAPTTVVHNGRNCYKITISNINWNYTTYIADRGENAYSIAQKLLIPEASILELNEFIKTIEDDLGGKTLRIQIGYAKKSIFYIDKETYLPILQEMSDDGGVFEHYEFSNIVINPAFKTDEFSENFPDYKF